MQQTTSPEGFRRWQTFNELGTEGVYESFFGRYPGVVGAFGAAGWIGNMGTGNPNDRWFHVELQRNYKVGTRIGGRIKRAIVRTFHIYDGGIGDLYMRPHYLYIKPDGWHEERIYHPEPYRTSIFMPGTSTTASLTTCIPEQPMRQ